MVIEPIILNGEVAGKVLHYRNLLGSIKYYQETLEELFSVPAIEMSFPAFFLQNHAQEDKGLLEKLAIELEVSFPLIEEVVGNNYRRLDDYFNTPPAGKTDFRWRSSVINILEHLGHYVWDLKFNGGKVSWVSDRVFNMVREEYEQKLLPRFEGKYKRLAGEAMKILVAHSANPPAEEPAHTISLLPLLTTTNFHSRYGRGVIYLKVSKTGNEEPHSTVYFDVGKNNQIMFDDLPGGKSGPSGIEPDAGYCLDTLSKNGLVGKPKMSLKAALDYLAK